MISILNPDQIRNLKVCGRILKSVMAEVAKNITAGTPTLRLDQIAESELSKRGARPAFKDYNPGGEEPFPASACVSINNQIVHGLPSENIILKEGDIVSIDIGAFWGGIYTDMAQTFPVGQIDPLAEKLLRTTRECLDRGISVARVGVKTGKIGAEIYKVAKGAGFEVVRDLVGHGIGSEIHMEPHIPNFGRPDSGVTIIEGMCFAIEPMLTAGSYKVKAERDGWTISTADQSLSAHFEHTVVIEDGKPVVVTG